MRDDGLSPEGRETLRQVIRLIDAADAAVERSGWTIREAIARGRQAQRRRAWWRRRGQH